MIDAHQHFWELSRGDYDWMDPDEPVLYRDRCPADLSPLMRDAGVTRTIVVQAATTLAETRYLLEIADKTEWVAGVVGWVDFESGSAVRELEELAEHSAFCGVRPMIQDISDPDWMLGSSLAPAMRALCEADLCFDALVLPLHLENLLRLLGRYPELKVVIDHAAKPRIAEGEFETWADAMRRIANETGACCKLSGLVTEAGSDWTQERLRPYCEHLLECFGSERMLWGSDWPVVDLAGGYARWRDVTLALLASLGESERQAILGGNAERFYSLSSLSSRSLENPGLDRQDISQQNPLPARAGLGENEQ